MRLWKVVVLLAGVAGVIGFFTPLIDYRSSDGRITGDASAFQMARNTDTGDVAAQAEDLGLSPDASRKLAKAFHDGLTVYRGGIVAFFTPAALLFLLGIISELRDRMGRLSGLLSIVFGAGCCAVFFRFWQADQASHDMSASLGLGLYLLLGAGFGGILGGLGALLDPDHGPG